MNIEFRIDVKAALAKGIDCKGAVQRIEVDPSRLTEAQRAELARHFNPHTFTASLVVDEPTFDGVVRALDELIAARAEEERMRPIRAEQQIAELEASPPIRRRVYVRDDGSIDGDPWSTGVEYDCYPEPSGSLGEYPELRARYDALVRRAEQSRLRGRETALVEARRQRDERVAKQEEEAAAAREAFEARCEEAIAIQPSLQTLHADGLLTAEMIDDVILFDARAKLPAGVEWDEEGGSHRDDLLSAEHAEAYAEAKALLTPLVADDNVYPVRWDGSIALEGQFEAGGFVLVRLD